MKLGGNATVHQHEKKTVVLPKFVRLNPNSRETRPIAGDENGKRI